MKNIKRTVLASTLASMLFAGTAEAQRTTAREVAQQRQQFPTERQYAAPRPPVLPRDIPRGWRQFESGVPINRSFSLNLYYSNGNPFYFHQGIPGYILNDIWFPGWCGPRAMSYSEIVARQWANIQGGPVGYGISVPRGFTMGYGQQTVENPVNEQLERENEGLRQRNEELETRERQRELEDADRRGYERRTMEENNRAKEQQPRTQVQKPPEKSDDKIRLKIEYNGLVDKVQYAALAKDFYNHGLFEGLRKVSDGDINLVAYVDSPTRVGIRDANNSMGHLVDIDFGNYLRCINDGELLDTFTSEIIERINIDSPKVRSARAYVEIEHSADYSASSCRK